MNVASPSLPGQSIVSRGFLLALALVLLGAPHASAQVVVDPQVLVFEPSTDHNTLAPDGRPLVSGYDFELYVVGAEEPFRVVSLGKPPITSNGTIRLDLSTFLVPAPASGVTYEARVAAHGPGGTAPSPVSNRFAYEAPCSYALDVTAQSFAPAGGSGTINVSTGSECSWSAVSWVSWLTLTGNAAGTGNGAIAFAVAPNNTASVRTGTINVSGALFTVTQAAAACAFSITPTSTAAPATGSSGNVSVSAPAGCSWVAEPRTDWLSITAGAAGTGNGTVAYIAAANTTSTARTGSILIADRSFTVNQAGASTGGSCSYTVSAVQEIPASGDLVTVTVTTQPGCAWTARERVNWITLRDSSGRGTGIFRVAARGNNSSEPRSASITVAGQVLVITQAGAPGR